jgi:hypothetical protein
MIAIVVCQHRSKWHTDVLIISQIICAIACIAHGAPSVGDIKIVRDTAWQLTWQDEFEGPGLNESNWTPANNYTHGE